MMQLGGWQSGDEEKRLLRIKVSKLEPALETQRQKRREAEDKVKELEREQEKSHKRIEELEKENEELKRQRDMYRGMIFKASKKEEKSEETEVVRVHLECCPHCGDKLEKSETVTTHTVEDIAPLEKVKTQVVRYEIESQWCNRCKKRVKGIPAGVIPGSRLGVNVFMYVLTLRYVCRNTWGTIIKCLEIFYGLKISAGTVVAMMHRGREWFKPRYDELLETIRKSPVKHADETTWRVEGKNHWLWGFFTQTEAYYAIHESRGKGVPQKFLAGSHPDDVLIRDDYGGYKKLPFNHQSCWAHLLRISHEAAVYPTASLEVKELHERLKVMYDSLFQIISSPFDLKKRKKEHKKFSRELLCIIKTNFHAADVKKIQTRIANQNTNLITALNFENVPLTNNRAEQGIRPMVVTRKISGGSRSPQGADTHAVHMSILQSTLSQKKPLIETYRNLINSYCQKTE